MVGTVPDAIQTPTSTPIKSRIRMASSDWVMPSIIPSSISSQLYPMTKAIMPATVHPRTRGICGSEPNATMHTNMRIAITTTLMSAW